MTFLGKTVYARFLTGVLFVFALSAASAMAEEYSPLAPPEPPVIEFVPVVADPPPAPLGLDTKGAYYCLVSNNRWKGAKQVKLISKPQPDAFGACERQVFSYIWRGACLASAQKVTFTRTYYLPGPPKDFAARVLSTKSGIKLVRVYINGKFAFGKGSGSFEVPLTTNPTLLAMFKNGNNEITVEVTKLADTAYKPCKGPTPLGVAFEFKGNFSADMQGSGAPGSFEYAKNVDGATSFKINNNPDVRNLGPSAIYHATFITSVSATGGRIRAFQLVPLGGAINGCDLATDKRRMECDITKWPKGGAKSFPSGADVDLHPTGGNSYVRVDFSISSNTLDPVVDNNFRSMTVHLCRTGDTNPKCSLPAPP